MMTSNLLFYPEFLARYRRQKLTSPKSPVVFSCIGWFENFWTKHCKPSTPKSQHTQIILIGISNGGNTYVHSLPTKFSFVHFMFPMAGLMLRLKTGHLWASHV